MERLKLIPGQRLSEHLSADEVLRVHVGPSEIDSRLPALFEILRKHSGGTPMRITDSGRLETADYGAKNSAHKDRDAFDISISATQREILSDNLAAFLADAVPAGLGGFGVYATHVHLDTQVDGATNYWSAPGDTMEYLLRHWTGGESLWLVRGGGEVLADSRGNIDVPVLVEAGGTDNTFFFLLILGAFLAKWARQKNII